MLNKSIAKNRGFTLVEVIIYITLFVFLISALLSFSLSVSSVYSKGRSMEEVLYGARGVKQFMSYYIKNNVDEIIYPLPTLASSSLVMTLVNGKSARVYLQDGQMMVDIGLDETIAITANEIRVSNLNFRNLSGFSDVNSIVIDCVIDFVAADSMEYMYNYNFNTTVNMRN